MPLVLCRPFLFFCVKTALGYSNIMCSPHHMKWTGNTTSHWLSKVKGPHIWASNREKAKRVSYGEAT